jgi:CubicO group peptidase (beta-lactamase class C family)
MPLFFTFLSGEPRRVLAFVLAAFVGGLGDPVHEAPAPVVQEAPAARTGVDLAPRLAAACAQSKLPGVAAVVVRGGEVVARGASGVRRAGHTEAVTSADRWHLGSCTKAMTAVLVARLVDAKVLDFERPVLEYLPEIAAALDDAARERWKELTLLHLVTNRSGMGSPHDDPLLWAELWKREGSPTQQRARLAAAMFAKEPAGPFGRFLYSNANTAIAGFVAETVTGTPYEELMQEHVFAPLGMTTAGFGVPWDHDLADGASATQPWPHGADGSALAPSATVDNPPSIAPAGTVHASLDDWAKFVTVIVRGARGEPSSYLSEAAFEKLLLAHPTVDRGGSAAGDEQGGYAAGWMEVRRSWARGANAGARGICYTHTGSNNSWFAVAWLAPERDFAVLVATNCAGAAASAACDAIVGDLVASEFER